MSAQQLTGKVTDESGEPLPFATIYRKGSTDGSSTNIQGRYTLSLQKGVSQVIFQHVGYKRQVFEVDLEANETLELNVILEPDIIQLKEIVVTGDGKDPAYYTIAQAMKYRKYHLEEVLAYKCNVYIKGMQSITKKPNRVMGFTVTIDTGIVYLSESVSELSFMRPDKYKEKMISSRVSGNNRAFSYNQASEMNVNFYENLLTAEGLSERGFISPIASNALFYYDYKLASIIEEDGYVINKIKVIPKRKNDPVFSGYIYIIEGSWRIHSVDLVLTKDNQIEFIDKLYINQVYAPVEYGIWMMLSQKFSFDLNVFGFEGKGTFMAIHSNYKIEPSNKDLVLQGEKPDESNQKVVKIAKKKPTQDSELFGNKKKYFNNEVLAIDEEANKRDTTYWESIRPIPLTNLEKRDYRIKDSMQVIVNSKSYKDSIDAKANKVSVQNVMMTGFTYRNTFEERYFTFDPVTRFFQFNTVEGVVLNARTFYSQQKNEQPWLRISPEIRYGFSSRQFYGHVKSALVTDLKRFGRYELSGGHFISQFNESEPIPYWANTIQSLAYGNNYMKLFEKSYAKFGKQLELDNGLVYNVNLEYARRRELFNTTDFTFAPSEELLYTANTPENIEVATTSFPDHRAFVVDMLLRVRFQQKYISRPDRKFIIGSKYPRVNIFYKKGMPILGSQVDFDLAEIKAIKDFDYKMLGDGTLSALFGVFLRSNEMYFPDFKHFNGSRINFSTFNHGDFQLLDYYHYSTMDRYFTAHYEHHFNGFLTNKIPLVKKLKVQTVATINYLNTPALGSYVELGIGLEHIFKIGRLDYFISKSKVGPDRQGVRFGIGF